VQSAPFSKNPHARKYALTGLLGGGLLFVLLGLSPETDVDIAAHFGGFITGLILGAALIFAPRLTRSAAANEVAGGLFCVLTIVPWWLAFRRH